MFGFKSKNANKQEVFVCKGDIFATQHGIAVLGIALSEIKVYDNLVLNKRTFKVTNITINGADPRPAIATKAGQNCALFFEKKDKDVKEFIVKALVSLTDEELNNNKPIKFTEEPENRYVTFYKK